MPPPHPLSTLWTGNTILAERLENDGRRPDRNDVFSRGPRSLPPTRRDQRPGRGGGDGGLLWPRGRRRGFLGVVGRVCDGETAVGAGGGDCLGTDRGESYSSSCVMAVRRFDQRYLSTVLYFLGAEPHPLHDFVVCDAGG